MTDSTSNYSELTYFPSDGLGLRELDDTSTYRDFFEPPVIVNCTQGECFVPIRKNAATEDALRAWSTAWYVRVKLSWSRQRICRRLATLKNEDELVRPRGVEKDLREKNAHTTKHKSTPESDDNVVEIIGKYGQL